MEGRAGSISPGPDLVYNSQEEDVGNFLAQYGGVSLSQGSMGQVASELSQTGLQSQSLQGSPQRSPYHRSPRLSRPSHHPHPHSTPPHQASPGRDVGFETGGNVTSTSWANIPAAATTNEEASVNYPVAAAEILDILKQQMALLTGGRDRQGQSLITFPAKPKTFTYNRDDVRKVVQYLTSIPTEDVQEYGFSVIVDARSSNWHNTKLILRALQEALPAQIHVVYIVQPGHFWKKTATSRGHSKEKGKLEFSTVMISVVDKLIRHVESSQLTSDLGGFLPYNHEEWIELRLKLEHFIASFNALMEHTAHVEQQLHLDQEAADVETSEEFLARHMQMQDQLKKAPQNTIREGNELLRALEQGKDEAGASSVTPDKINAVAIIRRLLENISRRQVHLEDLWKERKVHFEQMLQLRVFEKAMLKVRSWLKSRGEDMVSNHLDIGESVDSVQSILEQHEKFEAKTRSMYNSLTQLRRMADRFTGAHHFAANSLQRQVAKLNSRFSKFKSHLSERRKVVDGSMRLHTSVHEWRGHWEETMAMLKQEISVGDLSVAEQSLSDHNDTVQQLSQMAETAITEANSLLDLMDAITQRAIESRSVRGGGGPDYSIGIGHVEELVREVESQRKRVEQLAEARKLQLEQFKQLFSCEKDTKQVTQWLTDMVLQMASTHGDIGDSREMVERIINEHDKFTETAKKTYRYGCDLLSAVQRTRKACHLDLRPNAQLLEELGGAWERLSGAAVECRARLVVAQQFHLVSEEVMSHYLLWITPIHQLPKSTQLVEERLRDLVDNWEGLIHKMKECISIGSSLLDRLCCPLTADPTFRVLNENTKHSLSLLRTKLEELERKAVEAAMTLPQQQAVLRDFLTYCEFEQNIEQVLLWLQDQGLKKMHLFSHVGETQSAIQSQAAEFESFDSTCKEYTHQVKQLHTEAPSVESQIQGFQPDLVRKTTSLLTVWEKFLQRVENRRDALHMATSYYGNLNQLQNLLGDLEASLNPSTLGHQGQLGTYLTKLAPKLQQMDEFFSAVVQDGGSLAALLRRPPVDPSDPGGRIDTQLGTLEVHKRHVEELWLNALTLAGQAKQKVHLPPIAKELVKTPKHLEPVKTPKHSEPVKSPKHSEPVKRPKHSEPVKSPKQSEPVKSPKHSEPVKTPKHSEPVKSPKHSEPVKSPKHSEPVKTTKHSEPVNTPKHSEPVNSPKHSEPVKTPKHSEPVRSPKHSEPVKSPKHSEPVKSLRHSEPVKSPRHSEPIKKPAEKSVAAMKYSKRYEALKNQAYKYLESLELECDSFLTEHAQMGDTLEAAEKLKTQYKVFLETIQPACTEIRHVVEALLSLKSESPDLAPSVEQLCAVVGRRVKEWRESLQGHLNVLQMFVTFSSLFQEANLIIQSLDDYLCQPMEEDVAMDTAQQLLGKYQPLVNNLRSIYPRAKLLGEKFLEVTTGMLEVAEAKVKRKMLSVGDACTSVAVELGELEGKYLALMEMWEERERRLQTIGWEAFKMSSDQICSWLKDSAEKFLQSRVDLGTSLETAEDLLMEHEEFQTRAKSYKLPKSMSEITNVQRIASEVESLLSHSEEMLSGRHFASAELKKRAREMRNLHSNLQMRVESRQKALSEAIVFYRNSQQIDHDMDIAVEACKDVLPQELPSNQRVSSVSTRLTNLQHQAEIICKLLGIKLVGEPLTKSKTKHKARRSDSSSATEIAIKQTLVNLVKKFTQYKLAVEMRKVSPLPWAGRSGGARDTGKENLNLRKPLSKKTATEELSPKKQVVAGVRRKVAALNEKVDREKPTEAKAKAVLNLAPTERVTPKVEGWVVTESATVKLEATVASEMPSPQVCTLHDTCKASGVEETEFSTEVSISLPPNKLKNRRVFISSASKDIDPMFHKPRRRMSSSSTYIISPPGDDMRKRANTLPRVCRAMITHSSPIKKVSLITINVSSQKEGGGHSPTPKVSRTMKFSPTSMKPWAMRFTGQVSNLRSMFDSKREGPSARWSSSPPPLSTSSKRFMSPDIVPKEPPRPEPPVDFDSSTSATPTHGPPPRPPSPIGYYLDHMLSSSSEFESDSDVFESSEETLSPSSQTEDETDGPQEQPDSGKEKRVFKSMSVVLAELLKSEQTYLYSLEMLAEVYLPSFHDQHLPTFLQGRGSTIFANVEEIFVFQRKLYRELMECRGSVEDVCRCLIRHGPGLHCYIPFIHNLAQGVRVLSQYGGTFFEDLQREEGDDMSLLQHYTRPKTRLVEYNQLLKELLMCAQKEFLYGVSTIKDALRAVQLVLRAVDNAIAISNLQGCPFTLDEDHMIRMEPFIVYTSQNSRKRKPYSSHVYLHQKYVVFTQAVHDEATGTVTYVYRDSLLIGGLQLVETYKGHKDKFALFEGSLSSGSELYVLQPSSRDIVVKQLWLRDINAFIKKTPRDQLLPVLGEEYQPLPLSFISLEQPPLKEPEPGWFGSLRRKHSFKGRDSVKQTGSLKRKRSIKDRDVVKSKRSEDKDPGFKRKDSKKMPKRPEASASDQPQALQVANIQLATLTSGQFQAPELNENEDLYVVVEPFSSEQEEFLTVEKGQLVEVLDQGGSNWLVLTIPAPGELEAEGFLPSVCLRPAGEAGFSRPTSKTTNSSHASGTSQLPYPSHQPRASGTSSMVTSEHSTAVESRPRPHPNEFVSQLVEDVYYAKEDYRGRGGGLSLTSGQAVEVLDISDGDMWLVKTVDPQTGKPTEGLVPSMSLVPKPPGTVRNELFEAETGQEVPQAQIGEDAKASADAQSDELVSPKVSTNVMVMPNSLFGMYEPPQSLLIDEPTAILSTSDEQLHLLEDLETAGQNVNAALKRTNPVSDLTLEQLPDHPAFEEPPRKPLRSLTHRETSQGYHDPRVLQRTVSHPDSHYPLVAKYIEDSSTWHESGYLPSSLHSLPASFSPVPSPTSPHSYFGYDSSKVPTITLSQPNLNPAIQEQLIEKLDALDELKRLQDATVKSDPGSTELDEFDPVEIYVAIADFEATEETNISLTAGQHVQVLDASRSDWWLVTPTDTELKGWVSIAKGWVPATYLEKRIIDGTSSPPPEPFMDEMGELSRLMMKGRSLSEVNLNRRELYKCSFLATPGMRVPEKPSEAQLQGVFSSEHPYVASTEIQADQPGQLSLIANQPVNVLDSKREDWWLVKTMPEDGFPGIEGWVPGNKLQPAPYIRENLVEESRPQLHPPAVAISPASAPLWVVLADYQATESGMLTVYSGELVEVIDISRNEWCLVKTTARDAVEGWVPAAFLKPYDTGGYAHPNLLPPRFHYHSNPDDSDTSTDLSEPGQPNCFSPEVLEAYDDEERRAEAEQKRRFVLSELVSSECDYVEKLEFCIENYVPAVEDPSAPRPLKILQKSLFGNLSKIYNFHKQHFLPALVECESDPTKLGDTFESAEEHLHMYVTYCKNKSQSETVYREFTPYFEELRSQLRDRLDLPYYLILPVQRITKYNLLLADFHKNSIRAGMEVAKIEAALRVTRGISTQANNAVHLSMMEGIERKNYGELVLQDVFVFQEGVKPPFKERRVFLFERALIISKKQRNNSDRDTYEIKEELMLNEISMAQDMDDLRRNIIIYEMLTGTKFILRAPKTSIRNQWLTQSNDLIRKANTEVANLLSRQRSSSVPGEYLSRSPSFAQRSAIRRDREVQKRSLRRPHSSTGVRMTSPSPLEEQVPEGTEYIVMECIVMEGGDDMQLEPGEVVELVKVEGSGSLRVRTKDEHPFEGNIPAGFLRRKDSVRGGKMETTPKFTMTPTDMTLVYDNTATISCAFNGYPNPSVVWRRDRETLISDDRTKITSCATSSILEVIQLKYEDAGIYTCYITNQQGSNSASMMLSIHGPPTHPQKPTVSRVTSTSMKLKWSVPEFDGSSPILSYQIEMLQLGSDQWQPIVQHPKNSFIVKTLEPNMSYQFRVIAYNEFGASGPSEPSEVVSTKGKGWFIPVPSTKKTALSPRDYTDAPFDEIGTEEGSLTLLSPKPQYMRRGSVSTMYDVLPEELGRGRFGIVHKCVHKKTGTKLAAKYVRLRARKKPEVRREVEILLKVSGKSPYILTFHEAFERGRNLIIVTELIPDGELVERIIEGNDLTEGVVVGYIAQLLSALECIHNMDIAHLDIKPENILLAGPMVKLIDFGSARELTPDITPASTSSPEFCSPEVVNMDLPTLASDLWSVGVLTYVLLSGISPFFVDNIHTIVERIREARYDFYSTQFEQISQDAKDFIAALLQKSPEYRMSATEARQHIWIKTLGGVAAGSVSPWPMAHLDISQLKAFNARRKWHTAAVAVDSTVVFGPRSALCPSPLPPDFEELGRNESLPQLWDGPTHIHAPVGTSVSIQYQVSGSPKPSVVWEHEDEPVIPSDRSVVQTSGGTTTLTITDVTRDDEGVYMCCALNSLGSVAMETNLTVLDTPGPPTDVNGVILGSYNSVLVSWLPPASDGNCPITYYTLQRRRIEFDVWEDVSRDDSTAHVIEDLLPGMTYLFRVAAVNEIGISPYSKPSAPVVIAMDSTLNCNSPTMDVRMKKTSFKLEYMPGEEIGRGTFAVVRQCTEISTDRQFAAKLIPCTLPAHRDLAVREFEIHHQLAHPRIVSLEDAFESKEQITLVLEYLPGGNLQSYLAEHMILSEQVASRLLRKVVEGLQYLHDAGIIHCNLTPENILLTAGQNDLRIGDFGTARYIEACNQLNKVPRSPEFMAPEVVNLQPLTTAADIWSVGTIAYLMLTGMSPFVGPTHDATIANITSIHLATESREFVSLSLDSKDFILDRVLLKNPRRRLKAPQCQRHRWLQAISHRRRSSLERTLELSHKYTHLASMSQD